MRVNSPGSCWAGAAALISASGGSGVAAVGIEAVCAAVERRMRVNSPGACSAGAGASVAAVVADGGAAAERRIRVNSPGAGSAGVAACVAPGLAAGGAAAERSIRVSSPGSGSVGVGGTFRSSSGITIEAVGNSSRAGGGRRTCSGSFTDWKSRVNSPDSEAGVALFAGASVTAGILQTPLRAGLSVGVGEGTADLAAASHSRNFRIGGKTSVTT